MFFKKKVNILKGNVEISKENTKTIYDLVVNAANHHGDSVFLRYEDNNVIKDITFKQFLGTSESVSAWTEENNKLNGNKVRIGIIGGSSHEYFSVLIGVMANGNVAIPLDIQLDRDGLADNINRADIDYLFYDWDNYEALEGIEEKCPNLKGKFSLQRMKHVNCVQDIWDNYADKKSDARPQEDECAMVLFTSGTTGKGKGVMLSQSNLIDNVFCTDDIGDPSKEVYMNVLPIHHIFCINGDLLLAFRYGNVLCLNQDLSKLAAHIQLFQPSVIRMVPMMAKALYNRIAVLREQYKDKSIDEIKSLVLGERLHKIVSGGGYLAPELAKCFWDIGVKIAQGYGMSECSPKISAPDWTRPDKVASIGKLVYGCEVRIAENGEIQVKSPSVMMGYYKDEEETNKMFTEDGWLKTGDLGRFDDEGFLFFTGRCKNLIILGNGENVAPEQIENMFDEETLIQDIIVYGENDRICAEIYPNFQLVDVMRIEDVHAALNEIVQKRNEKLPPFKRIMEVNVRNIPFEKTSSKKIIRGKYFEQKQKRKENKANMILPQNDMQKAIYDCIVQCLGHNDFGIDTSIFQAGLDSLGSTLLISDLYEKLNISLTLGELSVNDTVEKIEKFSEESKVDAVDYSIREIYPLTGLQSYFGYILRGHTTANIPLLFKLDNSVDLERLKWAVEQVFEVHVEMKDIIQLHEGRFVNIRNDNRDINIPILQMSDDEWEVEKTNIVRPFMHSEGEDLFHSAIYVTDSANYFFFDLAHIIGDGMSVNIIIEDINAIYKGEKVEKQSYTMYDYILDEIYRNENGIRIKEIEYYLELTKDIKIDKSILARKDSYGLEKGEYNAIKEKFGNIRRKEILEFCKKNGISENVLFYTAFNYCVSIFANNDDILTTSIHSGRTDGRWNRLVGSLFITYLFRYTRIPHETVPQLLKRCANQILKTMDYHISNLHADEMFFQYQGDILNMSEIGGFPAERQKIQLDALPFHLQIFSNDKSYTYELRFWENRYDVEQLQIFMKCYEIIINAMVIEPSVRRLKKHIPDELRPKHFYIEAGKINDEAGYELIKDVNPDTKVKAYVLDDSCLKKPFGAWGELYIMDYLTEGMVDSMANPYGEGTLYQTGITARINQTGEVDFINNAGRIVLRETLKGRLFPDLKKIEDVVCEMEGIDKARAYSYYGNDNGIHIGIDISGESNVQIEDIKQFVAEKLDETMVPDKLERI